MLTTPKGDGFSSCWTNIQNAFETLRDLDYLDEDCIQSLLNLICGHFGTMRQMNDLYESPVWVPLLSHISSILSSILRMKRTNHFSTPEEIADQVEMVFDAIGKVRICQKPSLPRPLNLDHTFKNFWAFSTKILNKI